MIRLEFSFLFPQTVISLFAGISLELEDRLEEWLVLEEVIVIVGLQGGEGPNNQRVSKLPVKKLS